MSEQEPLLPTNDQQDNKRRHCQSRGRLATFLVILVAALILFALLLPFNSKRPKYPLTKESARQYALGILAEQPLIDTHIDVPEYYRTVYRNQVDAVDLSKENATIDISLPNLERGRVGGFFFSCYTACPSDAGQDAGPDFLNATWRVRDTLEQIDTAKLIIDKYPDVFQFADTSADILRAFKAKKLAGLIGLEGGHQLGNTLSSLRLYRQLGVRYITLTHMCHNALADSAGFLKPLLPLHHGLSEFGKIAIKEFNRLGILVDVSHTSDETTNQALSLSLAPPIFSHSSARALFNVPRNIPDSILERIGRADQGDTSDTGVLAGDALISATFAPFFHATDPKDATLELVADHIDHLGKVAGRRHIGLGSDFDGLGSGPRIRGLEDASKYPDLLAELLLRGWTEKEIKGLVSGNLLRILDKTDAVSAKLKRTTKPATDLYEKRRDL